MINDFGVFRMVVVVGVEFSEIIGCQVCFIFEILNIIYKNVFVVLIKEFVGYSLRDVIERVLIICIQVFFVY